MTARADAAKAVGFDEKMQGYALGEDEDFSYRLSRLGRITYLPDAVVHHHKLGPTSQTQRAFNRAVVENRAYLFRKNFKPTPASTIQFAAFIALLVGHRLMNFEWAGVAGLIEGGVAAVRRPR
jgi:GT2 family glycosyltransferase